MRTNSIRALTLTALLAAPSLRPVMAEQLPGEYALRTVLKNSYLTARPGNHTFDALITSATAPGRYEKFRIERMRPNYTLIKSASNYFVSAANAGGRGGAYGETTTLQTERQIPADDALFRLQSYSPGNWAYTIQTYRGYYLTALFGGGSSTAAFNTNATKASTWEGFRISQCGVLGSGYNYAIFPQGSARPINTISPINVSISDADAVFKLTQPRGLEQFDLSYTKFSGSVGLVTIRGSDCTWTMRAATGWVGVNQAGKISNTIHDPQTGASQGYNTNFELRPIL